MSKSTNLLITFLTGAIAGGALAYASQTKEGKKMTKKIKRKAKAKYEDSVEALKEQKGSIEDSFNDAMAKIDVKTLEKKGKEALENFKEKLNKA